MVAVMFGMDSRDNVSFTAALIFKGSSLTCPGLHRSASRYRRERWLAAAPVVAFGAPPGAFVVDFTGRKPTLFFAAILYVGQPVWTLRREQSAPGAGGIVLALFAVGLCLLGFKNLRAHGDVRVCEVKARRSGEATNCPAGRDF